MPAGRRHWPLPDVARVLPPEGAPGSFWEDRADRHHTGVDLYAPRGSTVVAIEEGMVVSTTVFTSPDLVPYWNRTFEVTVAHPSGIFARYAELGDVMVKEGMRVRAGEVIGRVGEVLNLAAIGEGAPAYIRALREKGLASMLHFETWSSVPGSPPGYRGGNWFSREWPPGLFDPVPVLRDAL